MRDDVSEKDECCVQTVTELVYSQSISDADGVMLPMGESVAYFAITGTPTGGRNDLSIKNEFTILVSRASPKESPPPSKPAKAKNKKNKGGSKK